VFSKDSSVSRSKAALFLTKCHHRVRQLLESCYVEVRYENHGFWAPGWYGMIYCPDYLLEDVGRYLLYLDRVGKDIAIVEFGYGSASEAIQVLEKHRLLLSNPKHYLELIYILE